MSKRAKKRNPNRITNKEQPVVVPASDDQQAVSPVEAKTTAPANRWMIGLLAVIIALAFAIRVYRVVDVPHGFFCDEASIGLDAYSLGHHLRDKDGQGSLLPTFIEGLGQWRGAFHTYCAIPFVWLFGLTEFAVRLTAVVSGTLTVWLTYLFASRAVNRAVGLLSAFLLAISPWHILNSRAGWDVISLPFIIALFLTFFYLGLERPAYLRLACAGAALGLYGYFSGRLFMPLFCLACLAIYATPLWQQRRVMATGFLILAVMLIPTGVAVKDGVFFQRLNEVSDKPQTLNEMMATFEIQYVQQYSSDFLLYAPTEPTAHPNDPILRQFVQHWGMIYYAEVPFLLIGLGIVLWRRNRFDLLCLFWFATYPVANALVSAPNSTRAISGVIIYQLLIAQGIYGCLCFVKWLLEKRPALRPYQLPAQGIVGTAIIGLLLWDTALYMQNYLEEYPKYSSGFYGWQWGAGATLAYFRAHSAEYDHMYMDGEYNAPYELYRFYSWPYGPNNGPYAKCDLTGAWVWWFPQQDRDVEFKSQYNPALRQLWAVGPPSFDLIKKRGIPYRVAGQINYPDNSPAFYFVATGPGAG